LVLKFPQELHPASRCNASQIVLNSLGDSIKTASSLGETKGKILRINGNKSESPPSHYQFFQVVKLL